MQHWRCQCGELTISESGMPPQDCDGCDDCGTTFAQSPGGHKPREPHKMRPRFNPSDGLPEGGSCSVCFHRDKSWPHP